MPGPGNYNLNRTLISKKPYTHVGPSSSFQDSVFTHKINLKDPVDMQRQLDLDLLRKKNICHADLKIPSPGPGDFEQLEYNFISDFFNFLYIYIINNYSSFNYLKDQKYDNVRGGSNFIQDESDRFGNNQKFGRYIYPGPATYVNDVTTCLATDSKHLVNGATFLSETERSPYGNVSTFVSPNKYNPAY